MLAKGFCDIDSLDLPSVSILIMLEDAREESSYCNHNAMYESFNPNYAGRCSRRVGDMTNWSTFVPVSILIMLEDAREGSQRPSGDISSSVSILIMLEDAREGGYLDC